MHVKQAVRVVRDQQAPLIVDAEPAEPARQQEKLLEAQLMQLRRQPRSADGGGTVFGQPPLAVEGEYEDAPARLSHIEAAAMDGWVHTQRR